MRRLTLVVASIAFVASVWFANWLVNRYGPIRVWPTHLYAPAGVYVVGVAFLLRDTIQRFGGQLLAVGLIAAGTAASVLVSPRLALASGLAFAASEAVGLLVFWVLRGTPALTQRQQAVYDLVRAHRDVITADEAGAAAHAVPGRRGGRTHAADYRCDWCAKTGRQILDQLVTAGLVKRRRGGERGTGYLYVPADQDAAGAAVVWAQGDLPEGF